MFAKSVLVTGCNRGIGLELIKQLAGKTEHLFATCRTPDEAEELNKVAEAYTHVIVIKLDVTNEEEIAASTALITEIVGDKGLNCIINNAGANHREKFETMNPEVWNRLYAINTIAPAMIIKACLPLMRQASALCSDDHMSVSRASILNISTKLASITDNDSGGKYGYRMSKAALNMLTKNLSIELKSDRILAAIIHPGWVKTKMGGPNALISTTKCVEGMLTVVSDFTEKDTGMFYSWDGENIPW